MKIELTKTLWSRLLVVLASLVFFGIATAETAMRHTLTGLKWPNSPEEGSAPIESSADTLIGPYSGFSELIPYALASPDQEDAGSCLYMSLTGIAEWWLARINPNASRAHDGVLDLSERYMMNLSGMNAHTANVANWKTDSIYVYNSAKRSVKNKTYRFTKGWFVTDSRGNTIPASSQTRGAQYNTSYNWINETNKIQDGFVSLPKFEREVIFADPASNQWNVNVMPADIVSRVQKKLQERKAPVNVIYNHVGYWHSVFIVGYDDELDSNGCSFVTRYETYLFDQSKPVREQAEREQDAVKRAQLLAKADKLDRAAQKFSDYYHDHGGCAGKGMFYVRDSIYTNADDPYDFDLSNSGDEGGYSKTIILREYEWLRFLANHATQIYVK